MSFVAKKLWKKCKHARVSNMTKEERKQIEVEEGLENLSHYLDGLFQHSGNGLAVRTRFADRFDSECRRYADFVCFVLYSGRGRSLRRAENHACCGWLLTSVWIIVVGTIPFVGDAFDFFWKSNKQNMDLIRERATGKDVGTTGDYIFVFGIILLLILLLIGSILVSIFILGYFFGWIWDLLKF